MHLSYIVTQIIKFSTHDCVYCDKVTISYMDPVKDRRDRRQHLLDNYYFTCCCQLCSRPER